MTASYAYKVGQPNVELLCLASDGNDFFIISHKYEFDHLKFALRHQIWTISYKYNIAISVIYRVLYDWASSHTCDPPCY